MMKKILLALVKFYRVAISPYRPPCCRYIPTCSQYALEAIEKYGAVKGGWLAFRRILRCNPFHKGDMIRSREGGDRPLQPIPHRLAFHPPETAECGRAAGGGLPPRGQ